MHENPYTIVLLKLGLVRGCIVGDSMIKVFNFLIIHIYFYQWMYYVCICNDKIFQLNYQNKMLEKAKIYMIENAFTLWKWLRWKIECLRQNNIALTINQNICKKKKKKLSKKTFKNKSFHGL